MGDRLLSVFQGNGYYQYATCTFEQNNPNNAQNIGFPEDIEGVWTYLYFSHSRVVKKTVGFLKVTGQATQRIEWAFSHPIINNLAFYLAGKNSQYPSF